MFGGSVRKCGGGDKERRGRGLGEEKVCGGLAGETRCPVKMKDEAEGMGDFSDYIVELLDERTFLWTWRLRWNEVKKKMRLVKRSEK